MDRLVRNGPVAEPRFRDAKEVRPWCHPFGHHMGDHPVGAGQARPARADDGRPRSGVGERVHRVLQRSRPPLQRADVRCRLAAAAPSLGERGRRGSAGCRCA